MAGDRPLGVADLHGVDCLPQMNGIKVWYWCRVHSPATGPEAPDRERTNPRECIRIGPFMSEREANRLADDGTGAMGYTHDMPLGMEVER